MSDVPSSMPTGPVEIIVEIIWTDPALKQLDIMPDEPRFKGDKKAWHEKRVRKHAKTNAPKATRARIRKPVHSGGTKPDEPEHITVTYKQRNKDLGAQHVYTDGVTTEDEAEGAQTTFADAMST
ncbi:hypothetical protein PsYK624_061190 [Phanerochaete sordida]|uniref:Uncharacterized protein n=1 Tax=Phanerochaete sordida TaxID=48140 RepID=A0A9P3G8Y6_9APHY|nr:hypothetical protein PsYK624_061190 [Phanerochaete sordida]